VFHRGAGLFFLALFLFSGCAAVPKKSATEHEETAVTVRIMLQNNDSLTGKLVSVFKGEVRLKHETLGDINFKWDKVSSITTDEDVHVSLKSGDKITGRLAGAQKGRFKITGPEVSSEELGLGEITGINEPESDVTWKGEALFSYVRTAGNRRTSDSAFLFRGVRETGIDSIELKAAYNYGTVEDELSKRSSMGLLKYNYKLSRCFYTYLSTGAAMDYFKGLNLRTDIGGGEGWKAYDRKDFSLRFELGISYSNEDYIEPVAPEPDRDVRYGAGRSAAEMEISLNKALTFYQLVEFFTPFDHAKLWRFHSESVLSVNLGSNLSVKAGYILDHDRRAAEGTKRTDGKTMIGIGYKF
jgi:putative salt-induced outer membrane protein YdiY